MDFKEFTKQDMRNGDLIKYRDMGYIAATCNWFDVIEKNKKYYVCNNFSKIIYKSFKSLKCCEKYIINSEYNICTQNQSKHLLPQNIVKFYKDNNGLYHGIDIEDFNETILPSFRELKLYFYRMYINCQFKRVTMEDFEKIYKNIYD